MVAWAMVVLRIQNKGISGSKLADMVGGCQPTIAKIARGEVKQPKFDIGVKILDVHYDLCPDDHISILINTGE